MANKIGVRVFPDTSRFRQDLKTTLDRIEKSTVGKIRIAPILDRYDYILIDCSPSLGLITVNALVAADSVLIPVQCEYFALEGISKLLNTIRIVRQRLNAQLDIEGFLMTMYDSRTRLNNQIYEEVKSHFKGLVFETVMSPIPSPWMENEPYPGQLIVALTSVNE